MAGKSLNLGQKFKLSDCRFMENGKAVRVELLVPKLSVTELRVFEAGSVQITAEGQTEIADC